MMQPNSFFRSEQDPAWSMNGDPWTFHDVFDAELVEAIRKGSFDGDDLDAAQALCGFVHEELRRYGTDSSHRLSGEEIGQALRAVRAVLRRLGIDFAPPFRDFDGFRDYWSGQGMGGTGGWAARRGYLSELFEPVWNQLTELENAGHSSALRGVDGLLKNIIFASTGPKPEIVLRDAVNNVIEIVANGEYCLVYDRPLTAAGLTWGDLVTWWGRQGDGDSGSQPDVETARDLYRRLDESLGDNPAERVVFRTYCERYQHELGFSLPALLPQVYLHFDPFTAKERRKLGLPDRLPRERMDFLLLMPNWERVVLEVDGKQHYAVQDEASPREYAKMVAADRALRLRGYEVFRFGGYELTQSSEARSMLGQFFDDLYALHGIAY